MSLPRIRLLSLLVIFVSCVAAAQLRAGEPAPTAITATIEVRGGLERLFVIGGAPPVLRLAAADPSHRGAVVQVALSASDLDGRALPWQQRFSWSLPADGSVAERLVALDGAPGYVRIAARFETGAEPLVRATDYGVVAPPVPGLRPDSFFASNTSQLRRGAELQLLQLLGIKVQRAHFQPRLAARPPAQSAGQALELDFTEQDRALAEAKTHDSWPLPIVGYAFEGTRVPLAEQVKMHGPPRDADEFVATWERILRHYPEIGAYEFWNEPWIFGWTWAADGAAYRELQRRWCEMARRVAPKLRIVAGNSCMFTEDHIEADPSCWRGLLSGTSHHPYSGCDWSTMRGGGQGRSIDAGGVVTRRMGLPYYYITEGGTEYQSPGVAGSRQEKCDNRENAVKIVQYFVRSALAGAFQGDAQWDIGYGPGWTAADTTLAVMTRSLEDRPVVADIWPAHELLWGAVFADPSQITAEVRALPRAAELSARWQVPVPEPRAGSPTKVAVVWSETGIGNDHLDRDGTLTIADADGITACDAVGRPIAAGSGGLVVPFGESPVYLFSDRLSVTELRQRIASARLAQLTPANLYALSLARPADQAQTLQVRVENQLNRELSGVLTVKRLADGAVGTAPFTIATGALAEVAVPWSPAALAAANQYGVEIVATSEAGTVRRQQLVQVARFAKRAVTVDGKLDDWQGAVPALLDSDQLRGGFDMTEYLLNPGLRPPGPEAAGARVVARVYTAYDDANVYIAAAVDEDRLVNRSGEQAARRGVSLPYRSGEPDGLDHIRGCGDVLLCAFGFRPRVPGWGRQADDPWAWKGHFYDTDYQYAAHVSTSGAKLVRQWGPATSRRTAYQCEPVPGCGEVPGARIAIVRDEQAKRTVYEFAIPRSELALFDPAAGRCRFGFILVNDQPINGANALQWSEAAGVFDHWSSTGSFSPSWMESLPCQTFFGIGD